MLGSIHDGINPTIDNMIDGGGGRCRQSDPKVGENKELNTRQHWPCQQHTNHRSQHHHGNNARLGEREIITPRRCV
jgi:hypothetical protein